MAKQLKSKQERQGQRGKPPTRAAWLAGVVAAGGTLAACSQEPLPTNTAIDRGLSEEVFRIFCKRIAKSYFPDERTGARFDAPCDGDANALPTDAPAPRLASMVQHREETLTALREFFGKAQLDGGATFADGELDGFLNSLVPFYDPPLNILPNASRGIADVMAQVVDPNDKRGQDVLNTLERIGKRKGYRPQANALGALRPILSYGQLDELSKSLFAVLSTNEKGEDGLGKPALLATLRGLALELALPAEPKEDGDSTLDILLRDLLYKPLPGLENAEPVYIVARDDSGNAKGSSQGTPFPVAGAGGDRDPAFEYINVGESVFAGMMREARTIASTLPGAPKSALENLGAGLRAVYGTTTSREMKFQNANFRFDGASLSESPLFDLAHAVAVAMRYPETEDLLQWLGLMIEKEEDASATIDRLGLTLNDISKKQEYANAKLTGVDGTPNSPSDFWDDVIAVGMRMLSRPGQLEALIKSFADPAGAGQGKLYGTWMRYRDDITYIGAPITPSGTDPGGKTGAYSATEKTAMNTLLTQQYAQMVDRAQPDYGMNRSVWQRTLSLINALNGEKICNKQDSDLTVYTDLLGPLKFPSTKPKYDACELVEIADAVEIYSQAVMKTARITLKDGVAVGLGSIGSPFGIVNGVPAGSGFGAIQETYSDIKGFSDTPTPESLARFLFAPHNQFMRNLFDPVLTKDKVDVRSFEPNALFHMEIVQQAAGGATLLTAGVPLITALDTTETRDLTDPIVPKPTDGYMFGHMLSALHMHWPSKSQLDCVAPFPPGMEGCSQSLNKDAPFYAKQSNVVSYEPMLAEMLVEADTTAVLQRAAAVADTVQVNGKSGLKILADFAAKMLAPDPNIAYRDGRKYALTNSCVDVGGGTECANGVGRVIPQVSPLYLILDALKGIDQQFKKPENASNLDAWHQARSSLIDQFLGTEVNNGVTRLTNQNGRNLGVALCYFGAAQLRRHREAGDLESWSDGLTDRMMEVLDHPITAGAIGVLDALYKSPEAARNLANITAYITDATANPRDFNGMLTAIADTAEFVSKDPDLTPVVQMAALVAAPNAFDVIDGTSSAPIDAEHSAAYASIELARAVMSVEKTAPTSAISRLLKNLVSLSPRGETPIDSVFDIVGEVNRVDPLVPTTQLLNAEDYRAVFTQIKDFMLDKDRGLERLYLVIQGRKAD